MKEIILSAKEEKKFELYAYCFMTNHVHLFMKEAEQGDITRRAIWSLEDFAGNKTEEKIEVTIK